ncbi:hypothetical protein NRB56_76220 [Nocardia sp. RB56]|uniref:Uncharacterized protein n=1 Tax=Nocardia aurantia TaxID=2585199 RepID=A0A7K0E2H6_9NOCA|nr:hypothetical protein [Nocardia aurantia]
MRTAPAGTVSASAVVVSTQIGSAVSSTYWVRSAG